MTTQVDGPYCAIHDAAHRPCDPRDPLDAGVLSSDAPVVLSTVDADRVAALIEERPGPTEAMRALFAERRPCAGWVEEPRRWALPIRVRLLPWPVVYREAGSDWWAWHVGTEHGRADDMRAAQLAAEDALRAIAAEILRAVGA